VILPLTSARFPGTHRLIPSKYSEEGSVLAAVSDSESMLADLAELDGVTNERLLGEEGRMPGIGVRELVFGIRYASIVNAAFTHSSPSGGRFNGPGRGAWYAALERRTSVAEVAYHKARQLRNVDWVEEEISTYDDYLADFSTDFHDLRSAGNRHRKYLKPEPVPECYAESQQLAKELLADKSNGVVYPSVRRPEGTCVACFRPALVYDVRRDVRLELRLEVKGSAVKLHTRNVSIPDEAVVS
jgi:RES domain-containing protein